MVYYTKIDKLLKSKIGSPLEITLAEETKLIQSDFMIDRYTRTENTTNNPAIPVDKNKIIGYLHNHFKESVVLSRELGNKTPRSRVLIDYDAIKSYKFLK